MVLLNFIEVFSYCVLLAAPKFLMNTTAALNSQRSASLCPLSTWINMQDHVGPDFFFSVKVVFWQWRYHWCWCYSFLYFVFIFCQCTKRKLYLISLRCCLWLWAVSEYMLSIVRIEALSHLIIPFFYTTYLHFYIFCLLYVILKIFLKVFGSNTGPYLR